MTHRTRNLILLFLLSLSSLVSTAGGQKTFRHRLEALRTHLLTNYSGQFTPYEGNVTAEAFPVKVAFALMSILDLNAAKQILSTLSYLVVEWTDPDLTWDPQEVDSPGHGLNMIQFTSREIWTPSLLLINRADDNRDQMIDNYDLVTTGYNGFCAAHLPLKLDTTCNVDVTRYPFDIQTCKVLVGHMYMNSLNITATTLDLPLLEFLDVSGEWKVENIAVVYRNMVIGVKNDGQPDLYHFVEYQVVLNRQFIFYLLTVVCPIIVLSVTGACGFLLPLQCGEKVSFQVAIMVSLAVFLSFINDAMPKTSKSIPMLAVYVDLLLVNSCLSFLATLIVLRGHHHLERLEQEDKEQRMEQRDRERMRLILSAKVPEGQTISREAFPPTGENQAVTSRWRRMRSSFRQMVRRWYCCCCCIPPHHLEKFFFVFFVATALGSAMVFLI